MRRKSFTLVEMVVVVAIILIILSFALVSISGIWDQTHLQNVNQKITNLLQVARSRSTLVDHIAYGLLFYMDPVEDKETIVFIDALAYPLNSEEVWTDVVHRFTVDTKVPYAFPLQDFLRIAQPELLEWINSESTVRRFWAINNDYRAGNQRNFFAIIFQRGRRARPRNSYILYDADEDKDGFGDTLKLAVGDVEGGSGEILHNILIDENGEQRNIPAVWGFLVYDENVFQELVSEDLNLVPYLPYHLARDGKPIALERN